jgi:Transposase IS116/IS110/IS902 family
MAFLAREIEELDKEILDLIEESQLTGAYQLLQTIPGIRDTAAATILAESGPDMQQFGKPEKFCSWSGVAPGNNEGAGLRKRAPAMKDPEYQSRANGIGMVCLADQRNRVPALLRPVTRASDLSGAFDRTALPTEQTTIQDETCNEFAASTVML